MWVGVGTKYSIQFPLCFLWISALDIEEYVGEKVEAVKKRIGQRSVIEIYLFT